VQTGYIGNDGRRRTASDEALMGVLGSLGTVIERPESAVEVLGRLKSQRSRRVLEPVVSHREGELLTFALNLPEALEPAQVWLVVRGEDGSVCSKQRLSELSVVRTARIESDGARIVSRRVHVPVQHLPLPPGYHRLEVDAPGVSSSSLLVSAPRRAPEAHRGWGLFIALHALRGESDWGVGSYGDLGRLAHWVADLGGDYVGTLPLSAVFADVPFSDPSPYMPASRLAWNEAYIDVEQLPELASSPYAARLVGSAELRSQLEILRGSPFADPKAVTLLKRRVLSELAASLFSGSTSGSADALVSGSDQGHGPGAGSRAGSGAGPGSASSSASASASRTAHSARRDDFESFVSQHPELVEYARFRSECERQGLPFQDWHQPVVPPDPGGSNARFDLGSERDPSVVSGLYAQWAANEQLTAARARGAGLYLDFPVGVHPSGFDVWWKPAVFAIGASAGAPPDAFFSGGQVWGFPPLHPEGLREQGYDYFAASLRKCMEHASILRVDHVMGLHRMFFVPDGMNARDGVYVRYRAEELHAVLCLEAHRSGTVVVGEDLGTVPGLVRRVMQRDGLQRSFVFEFASRADDPLPSPPEESLASLATHDLPPFASFWRGLDVEERLARKEIDRASASTLCQQRASWRKAVLKVLGAEQEPEASSDHIDTSGQITRRALEGCLVHLARSPARLVMADLEDLWLESEPQNRPGTGAEFCNFLRRAKRTFEDFADDPDVKRVLGNVNRSRTADRTGGNR